MKRIKKLSVMLLCCLLLSVIAMPVSASAAKLNKKSISLNVGKTYTLKASGTKGKITWTSSKKSVATVSSKGVVKAKKKGTAVITAKYGKKKLTCKVTVKQPVKSIKLNKTSATLKKGKSLTLKATISPSSANNKAVTWSSSNKKVATVSSKGVVKAVGNGTATITVKVKDGSGKKATCKITVGTTNTPSNNTPIHTAIIGVKLNLGMINVVYGNHELHTKIDLTGDGNADQLDIQATGTGWSDNKFNGTLSISVNGKNVIGVKPGTYLKISRKWSKGDKVSIVFPMEERWVMREHHSKYTTYTLPRGEIMYKEEPTDRIPYAFLRGPMVYCLDMVWNKQLCNDDVDLAKDIRLNVSVKPSVVDKPYANMVGPVYRTKALYKGSEVEVLLTPFVDIGQWFRPSGQKPEKNAEMFTYGIWLYKE